MKGKKTYYFLISFFLLLLNSSGIKATVYTVFNKADLLTRMTNALPGDTVIVADGSYDWGQINFINNNGSPTSSWIVLKAQTQFGVEFRGSTYLHFKGTRIEINGFKFANGSAGTNAVISFRSSSSNLSNYCRITNIIIDNYNTSSADSSLENEWVAMYGIRNRVDHCTFINKYNARATVVVWYSSTTYPNPATSTFHRIDSNYFNGRSYRGANGGETIRVGDSNSSRTDGHNTIEFNLFENCTQEEPEIISNKSDFNVYRNNTFKNCNGGLTLRHGRYCSVYGNYFIVDNPAFTRSYGIRVVDKGHKIYNNYFEGLLGNKNSLTAIRVPILLYNGLASTNDTTNASKASGYFPADSCIVAFNTIVNCSGGAGIVLGFTNSGTHTFQPLGIVVANNIIKMTTGQAAYREASNTTLTYFAEGNMFNAPNGLGLSSSTGFANTTLNFGSRTNGILTPPVAVQDAAVNTTNYSGLLSNLDFQGQTRSALFDVGCDEVNGTGTILNIPLDATMVGAGTSKEPPVPAIELKVTVVGNSANLNWDVSDETNIREYILERSNNGVDYSPITLVLASNKNSYGYSDILTSSNRYNYRLKIVELNGNSKFSNTVVVDFIVVSKLNLFPNPVIDKSRISGLKGNSFVRVINPRGQVVMELRINEESKLIDFSTLQKGIYFIEVLVDGKQSAKLSFLKQ